MASSIGSTAARVPRGSYDIKAVIAITEIGLFKTMAVTVMTLLPILTENIRPQDLSRDIKLKQSKAKAIARKTLLSTDAKVKLIFTALSATTIKQMQCPIESLRMSPLTLFNCFKNEVSEESVREFLEETILPTAIKLKKILQKDHLAALDDVDLWKKSVDEKKS